MRKTWLHIAKAEFFVLTAGLRPHRKLLSAIAFVLTGAWAIFLAPSVMMAFISELMPLEQVRLLLMTIFPGLMRSVMMFLWILLVLFPMSNALQEIKIGHWEIYLSHNVKTRDILAGGFLGTSPLYCLITLVIAPILISPFMMIYEVSIIGQVLVYGALVLTVITALWLSTFLTAAVQSRLGDSSRGNDIAKALAMVVAIAALVPMYTMMFAMESMSQILGADVFLFMPFAWSADVVSWLTINFNQVGLTGSQILGFSSMLSLDLLTSVLLMGGFAVLIFGTTSLAADRVFTVSAGARTERVTTVRKENIIVRGARLLGGDSYGTLMATNLKDYFRKAQNISKMFYGVALAIILPVMMTLAGDVIQDMDFIGLMGTFGIMFAMVGGFPFVGVGFLESRDQLWILQGAPNGASKFIKSRMAMAAFVDIFLALIPAATVSILLQRTLLESVLFYGFGLLVVIASSMIGIGVTARNPDYEDTKSPAHQANMMMAMMIPTMCMMGSIFLLLALAILDLDIVLVSMMGEFGFEIFFMFFGPILLTVIGVVLLVLGIRAMSRPE